MALARGITEDRLASAQSPSVSGIIESKDQLLYEKDTSQRQRRLSYLSHLARMPEQEGPLFTAFDFLLEARRERSAYQDEQYYIHSRQLLRKHT